jgi:hypothetical protein
MEGEAPQIETPQPQPQRPGGAILEALLSIAAEVPAIGKDDTNDQQHYNFRSVDAIMAALKPLLVKHQVLIYPVKILDSQQGKGPKENGFRVVQQIVYRLEHLDGSYRDVVVSGEGVDYGDKACNKVMTASLKYMCGQVFFIPYYSEADPDKESPENGPPSEQRRAPSKKEPVKEKAAPPPVDEKTKALTHLSEQLKGAGLTGERALSWIMVRIGGRKITKLTDLTSAEFQKVNSELARRPAQGKAG